MDNKNKELERLNGVYMKLLAGAGVEYFEGRGKIVDAHTVEVNGKRYTVRAPLLPPFLLCQVGLVSLTVEALWEDVGRRATC